MEKTKAMLAHKYNPDKADYPAFIQQIGRAHAELQSR